RVSPARLLRYPLGSSARGGAVSDGARDPAGCFRPVGGHAHAAAPAGCLSRRGSAVAFTLLLIVLIVAGGYYFLGTPLLDFIHNFTKEFVRSFPLWSFFLPIPIERAARPSATPRKPGARPRHPQRPSRPI